MIRPTLLLVVLCLSALPRSARASDIPHHAEITRSACAHLNWSEEQTRAVIAANVATDICRLPAMTQHISRVAFRRSGECLDTVSRLAESAPFSERASVGFHFNSLYSYDDIAQRWDDLAQWADAAAEAIAAMPAGPERDQEETCLQGLVAHCVQDFYAHSNWVGICGLFTTDARNPGAYPTWEELHADEGWYPATGSFDLAAAQNRLRASNAVISANEQLGGLQTGRIRGEAEQDPNPWMHRHAWGSEQDIVHDLADRTTRIWLARLDARFRVDPPRKLS